VDDADGRVANLFLLLLFCVVLSSVITTYTYGIPLIDIIFFWSRIAKRDSSGEEADGSSLSAKSTQRAKKRTTFVHPSSSLKAIPEKQKAQRPESRTDALREREEHTKFN
jgi:hypothetical protein